MKKYLLSLVFALVILFGGMTSVYAYAYEDGSAIFQMEVVLNYELEKDLLGFGEGVKVLSPRILVHNMSRRLSQAADNYR